MTILNLLNGIFFISVAVIWAISMVIWFIVHYIKQSDSDDQAMHYIVTTVAEAIFFGLIYIGLYSLFIP